MLSADGSTVYVSGRDEHLWAINSDDGTAKWSVPLNYLAQTPPSVTPDGLVIAGGGPGSRLTAVRDTADGGEVLWTNNDTTPLTTSSLAGLGYAVTRDGSGDEPGLALTVFTLGDGNIVNTYPLPNASGFPVGVSIGHDGRVVAATSDGQVYGFARD